MLVWKLLWEAPGRFLCQDLVRSAPLRRSCDVLIGVLAWRSWSPPFTGPCERILWRSLWNTVRPLHDLAQALWEALEEARVKSCRCPYMISYRSLRRSCGDPVENPRDVLALRSWRCFALVLVWKFFWDAPRKLILCRSCEMLYIDLYRRSCCAVVVMSNLIFCCSMATAACIWHIDFPYCSLEVFWVFGLNWRIMQTATQTAFHKWNAHDCTTFTAFLFALQTSSGSK